MFVLTFAFSCLFTSWHDRLVCGVSSMRSYWLTVVRLVRAAAKHVELHALLRAGSTVRLAAGDLTSEPGAMVRIDAFDSQNMLNIRFQHSIPVRLIFPVVARFISCQVLPC